jgi:hypothetical protein
VKRWFLFHISGRYKRLTVCLILLLSVCRCYGNVFDWKGTGTSWTSASSWTKASGSGTSTYPGQNGSTGDIAQIGLNNNYSGNNPVLSSSVTVSSIIFGANGGSAMSLTVNSATLTTTSIFFDHNNNSGGISTTINGTGTFICQNLTIGNATLPPGGGGNNSIINFTTLNCSISNITVGGTLALNTTKKLHGAFANYNEAVFNLLSGNLTLLGVSASPVTLSTNPAQLNFTAGTVTYGAASGTQLVYIGTGITYPNLAFTGNSIKTSGAGTLSVAGNWTSSGGGVFLNTNNNTVSVSGNWTNSAAVWQGTGNISVTGQVVNSGTLTLGNGSFTISGNYTNNGTYTQGTGNTVFNGSSTVLNDGGSGTVFNKVFFNGGGTSLINSGNFSVSDIGILTMVNSTTLNANGLLTLLSDATGSAAVATIPAGCQITGTVNVQRYLTGNQSNIYRGYRLLSSPVNITSPTSSPTNYISLAYLNATVNGVHGAFTGGPGGGFTITNGNPSIYLYNESIPISNAYFVSGKHVGIYAITGNTVSTVSNATGPVVITSGVSIPAGNGYLLYFLGPNTRTSGSISPTPDNTTMTAPGYLNQGNITVNLWYGGTPGQLSYTASLPGPGFNMVGNPYASTIDLTQVLSHNSGINAVYTLSPVGPTQAYAVFTQSGNSSPSPAYAVSGEGFIVHATAVAQTLTFLESDKASTIQLSGPQLLLGKPINEPALTGLYMKLEQDSIHHSYCGIYFRSDWSDKFAPGDAIDINDNGSQLDVSSLSADGIHAAVNHMPDYTTGSRIRLYVNAPTNGAYTLKIEGIRNIDTLHDIWLVDHYKNDSLNIRRLGSYTFNIVKSDTASYGNNRFVLAIRSNPAYAYQLLDFAAHRIAHSPHVAVDWKTRYEQNYINFTVERSTDNGKTFDIVGGLQGTGAGNYSLTDKSPQNGQNFYRLKQEDVAGTITYSKVVTVQYDNPFADKKIHIFPNPASVTINLAIAGPSDDDATYCIRFVNSSGVVVKQITSRESRWESNISYLQPGTYLVRVTDNKTQYLIGENKFVKL